MLSVDVQLERGDRRFHYTVEHGAGVLGVVGRSGAGKTTLLHLVAGLLRPSAGTIRVRDRVLFDAGRTDLPAHRRRVGVVFQDDRLFPHKTVEGNLRYGERCRPRSAAPPLPRDTLIERLELEPLLARPVRHLSGGERRRVAVARALLAAPELLLLDEPLVSLDDESRRRTLELLRRVIDAVDLPMLYVSHDLSELLQLTRELLLIEGGETRGRGALPELARNAGLWPILRRVRPENVVATTVADHDAAAALTRLTLRDAPGGAPAIAAPLVDLPAGTPLRVAIRPEDIALARARVDGISIRNQVPARVTAVTRHPDRAVVEIDVGVPLLVEVSHQTVEQLELSPGATPWCLIKSNAVRYL